MDNIEDALLRSYCPYAYEILKKQREKERKRNKVLFNRFRNILVGSFVLTLMFETCNVIRNRHYFLSDDLQRYASADEAFIDLKTEKEKIGLAELDIAVSFDDENPSATTWINNSLDLKSATYRIELGQAKNRRALRHELYHVKCNEDRIEDSRGIDYFTLMRFPPFSLIEEWNATSYAISDKP